VLGPLQRLQVEQIRRNLAGLPDRARGADLPQAMLLCGALAEDVQHLLDVVDAVARP
jgi:hypothetical protein